MAEKRDLVFLWIDEGKEGIFHGENVNFGSEYVFRAKREGERLFLSGQPDPHYIPDFFSAPGQPRSITNLTAFVGKNGTGKTKLCKLIANIVKGQSDCEYISVVRITDGDVPTRYEAYHSRYGGLSEGEPNILAAYHFGKDHLMTRPEILDVSTSIPNCTIIERLDLGRAMAIYYSPIVDFSNTEFRESYRSYIDISSNHLLIAAVEEQMGRREKFDRVDLMNLMRSEDFRRQYELLMDPNARHFLKSISDVDVHTDRIWLEAVKLKHDVANDFWNVPITFQGTIKKLHHLYEEEMREWNLRLAKVGRESDTTDAENMRLNQERLVRVFAYYMLTAYLYNLNIDNTHQAPSGHPMPPYNGSAFLDGIRHFFNHQGIVNPISFLLCIDILEKNEANLTLKEHFEDEIKFTLGGSGMLELFINNLHVEEELSGIHYKKEEMRGHGFLKFEWGIDPSSGEKAFLDLYSRLYHARKMMKDGVGWTQVSGKHEGYPDHIIVILDEAELGFHPAWQQEFVANLTSALPWIFSISNTDLGRDMYAPNYTPLQLIISTHSPIALSDVPLNHAAFLERKSHEGRYVRKIMRGEELNIRHTFGANIHDHYRNSFFLTDHMLGIFAYNKIQGVVDDLNREGVSSTRAAEMRMIIDQIGEPVIRMKLSRMYEDKFGEGLTDEERLRFHEEEIRKIKARRKDEDRG